MERRHKLPQGWDGSINCRVCGQAVHLERDRMLMADEDSWAMICPACGGDFIVRNGDRFLNQAQPPEPAGMLLSAEAASPKKRWWLKRRETPTQP